MGKKNVESQINWPIKETPTITEQHKNCPYCHDNFDYWYGAETTSKLIKAAPYWAILVHFDYIDDDRTIPVEFCPK